MSTAQQPKRNPIWEHMQGNTRSAYDIELHKAHGGGVYGSNGQNLSAPKPTPISTPQPDELKATIAVLQDLINAMLANVD